MSKPQKRTTPIRRRSLAVPLHIALALMMASCSRTTLPSSQRMADGKRWTTENVALAVDGSFCYEDAEANCRQYGRLYTWESARRVCDSLGDGWRLPTDVEWRRMAKHYGGVSDDSDDAGRAAYRMLLTGGDSGFNALLGGGRQVDGTFARLEAHGFYWTASENDAAAAPFYNFGKGGQALHRQNAGEKQMAISVRCVTDRTGFRGERFQNRSERVAPVWPPAAAQAPPT